MVKAKANTASHGMELDTGLKCSHSF